MPKTKRAKPAPVAPAPAPAPTPATMTIAQWARENGLDPKRVRAKLRRAARAPDATITHRHREHWFATPDVLRIVSA
jgi:hypothetical protein